MFDNTMGEMLSNDNQGSATITTAGMLSSTSGPGFQVYFVLQPDIHAQVYLSMGVNESTPGSSEFLYSLYAVEASNTLSPRCFGNAYATTGMAGIAYVSFDMGPGQCTLIAGETYVVLVSPTSGTSDITPFSLVSWHNWYSLAGLLLKCTTSRSITFCVHRLLMLT